MELDYPNAPQGLDKRKCALLFIPKSQWPLEEKQKEWDRFYLEKQKANQTF